MSSMSNFSNSQHDREPSRPFVNSIDMASAESGDDVEPTQAIVHDTPERPKVVGADRVMKTKQQAPAPRVTTQAQANEDAKRVANKTGQSNNTHQSHRSKKSEIRAELVLPPTVPLSRESGDMINKMISPSSDQPDELQW